MDEFIIFYLLICVLCYVTGSIPFASLIVKSRHKKDITQHGTGNVGAMNSYDITGSKSTGFIVFIADFLKGFIPALVLLVFLELSFLMSILPLTFLVLGHCFSVFIKFKGGRGLATAAGIFSIVSPALLFIWCFVYFVTEKFVKNIHIASVFATLILPFPVLLLPDSVIEFTFFNYSLNTYAPDFKELLFVLTSSVCLIILIKHIKPVLEILKNYNINKIK